MSLVCAVHCLTVPFLVTMLPAVDPHWREMDRRPAPESDEQEPVRA